MLLSIQSSDDRNFWQELLKHRGAAVGFVLLALLIGAAIFAPWLAPYDPSEQFAGAYLLPPLSPNHWLGTDDLGRDTASRLLYGARLSLSYGGLAVLMAVVLGCFLGGLSAIFKNFLGALLARITDGMLALPTLLLAIVIVAILGPSLFNATLAVAICLLPYFARLTRAVTLCELKRDYVQASLLEGAGRLRIMLRVVLPNIAPAVIVQTTLSFSSAILDIAALGFLGLGAQPPLAEWGSMLAASRSFLEQAPWVVTLPGLAILITVLSANLLGDGLRDTLDPKRIVT